MSSTWGLSWGTSWGNSWGVIAVESDEGGTKKKRGRRKKKKLTQAEIEGLRAMFPAKVIEEQPEVVAEIVEEVVEQVEAGDITGMEMAEAKVKELKLESLTQIEKYEELTDTEDIALILAIIESLD